MSLCRIGQNERCSKTGCEFSKAGWPNCHSETGHNFKPDAVTELYYNKPKKQKKPLTVYVKTKRPYYDRGPKFNNAYAQDKLKKVYQRSRGICCLCWEPVSKRNFAVFRLWGFSIDSLRDIKYLRAVHATCKAIEKTRIKTLN